MKSRINKVEMKHLNDVEEIEKTGKDFAQITTRFILLLMMLNKRKFILKVS